MTHATDEAARIAEQGTILRCQVGSGLHGITVGAQHDRDEMGVCVEPPEYVIGPRSFEQYVHRTRPEGERSRPGDLDLTVYSLRKWLRLALEGNPTVLLPLFAPEHELVAVTGLGRELRASADRVVSRRAGQRALGYLTAQRDQLLGRRGGRTNRPELAEVHGFDTKYAYHMVRLGVQGVELMETGRVTLPMPEPWGSWLRALRRGAHTRDEALAVTADLEERLRTLAATGPLPPEPDTAWAESWLVDAYQRTWRAAAPV
ncbi:nucleotidyltransferase domain-containing protein [Streptomonospora sp. S1-112]|uniref:Nucleotidyltransferase domain-containing protein n=1 Tax=Streptomonospora mangrovi TaxID=2883123 RepID=A0A9X3SEU8_9ACTN|nr:nucleotidyltransferase domain-containing protein [Streptomonospora mangrovi]MDA0564120.1 nucleotidyltransferase domain-containing protein [Streptomonospora mangrovi]